MNTVDTESAVRQASVGSRWPERAIALSTLAAIAGLTLYLVPHWRDSAELSHGWFAPILCILLLAQSRKEPNWAAIWTSRKVVALQTGLCIGGIVTSAIAGLSALLQGPSHSQPAFLAGSSVALLVLSATAALARSRTGWVRLNGASLSAAVIWCLAVPLPRGTLSRLTLLLQDVITGISVDMLHLLGIAAVRHGNLIELANGLVGVEEACSGIRSLTASLFAGVTLGGLMLAGLRRRVFLVACAAAFALATNLGRSLLLCLLVAGGVDTNGLWHDVTGYAVLGLTLILLFGTCLLLNRRSSPAFEERDTPVSIPRRPFLLHAAFASTAALALLAVALRLAPSSDAERTPPDLGSIAGFDAPGWSRRTSQSVQSYSAALNTPYLHQETYSRGQTQVTFYLAYWPMKQSTLGWVALHTPDICLPGAGWTVQTLPARTTTYPIPNPQRYLANRGSFPQHIWFWHVFGNRVVGERGGVYPWQLASTILRRDVQARAPQCVIRVSSNEPLETLVGDPLLKEFFRRLHAAQLAPRP